MIKNYDLKVIRFNKSDEGHGILDEEYGQIKALTIDNALSHSSKMTSKWCKENNIVHRLSAPYRHQSMGIVERYNGTIKG